MSRLSFAWHAAFIGMAMTACLLLASALDASPLTAGFGSRLRGTAIGMIFSRMP